MKNAFASIKAITIALTCLISSNLLALVTDHQLEIGASQTARPSADGTSNGGGGHWFESNFKAKAGRIIKQIKLMPSEAKEKLKFDVYRLEQNLETPDRVKPLCAESEKQFSHLNGKMAYVGAPDEKPNVILLDCREKSAWENKFSSIRDGDIIFFLHELVRNNDLNSEADDNSYSISYSYRNAKFESDQILNQVIGRLIEAGQQLYQTNDKDYFERSWNMGGNKCGIFFYWRNLTKSDTQGRLVEVLLNFETIVLRNNKGARNRVLENVFLTPFLNDYSPDREWPAVVIQRLLDPQNESDELVRVKIFQTSNAFSCFK